MCNEMSLILIWEWVRNQLTDDDDDELNESEIIKNAMTTVCT